MKSENNRLREALLMVKRLFDDRIMFQTAIREAHKAVDAALAEPVLNCEVGTPEEQCRRWRLFCDAIDECEKCPCQKSSDEISADCFARWAKMPYVEKEGVDG